MIDTVYQFDADKFTDCLSGNVNNYYVGEREYGTGGAYQFSNEKSDDDKWTEAILIKE